MYRTVSKRRSFLAAQGKQFIVIYSYIINISLVPCLSAKEVMSTYMYPLCSELNRMPTNFVLDVRSKQFDAEMHVAVYRF